MGERLRTRSMEKRGFEKHDGMAADEGEGCWGKTKV